MPPIISRAAWGADESIRRRAALVAPDLRLTFVHHTATANDYPPEQSAAIVRSIYAYHVRHNGWNDIGYAFLVDRYGQIFEGRAGGVEQAIVGAHAQGFNTGSVGIALIGNGSLEPITPAARSSLVQLLTWRLDLAHLDPLARSSVTSRGNPRFPAGTTVALRTISGHRDVDATGCPGDLVEPELDAIAREVAAAPVPRIVSPRIGRLADGSIHLSARLLAASAWTITLLDAAGAPVATTAGAGPAVEWISPPGTATSWRIEAVSPSGEPARAATGRLSGGPAPPPIGLTAAPGLISPDGDGVADTATKHFLTH